MNFKRITAGRIAGILNLSKWKTPLDIYNELMGKEPEQNAAMLSGLKLENYISQRFEKETGAVTEKVPYITKDDIFGAMLDRTYDNKTKVLEMKATTQWVDDIVQQPEWFCQLQFQMFCADIKSGCVAWLSLPRSFDYDNFVKIDFKEEHYELFDVVSELKVAYFERDEEFITYMVEKAREFWENHVLKQIPPEPSCIKDTIHYFTIGKNIEANEEIQSMYEELVKTKQNIKELETIEENLKFNIVSYMKDAEILTFNNNVLATYKARTSYHIDAKRLEKEMPDIYKKFLKSTTSRYFLLR